MTQPFAIASLSVAAGRRGFVRIPVASTLLGSDVALPVHVVHGAEPGPVLGLVAGIHGAEHLGVWIIREALKGLDATRLRGTILAVPVANPLSFMQRSRITHEDDIDFGNMNRVFPGRRAKAVFGSGEADPTDRTLTEMLAAVMAETVLPRLTHLLDFHTHFNGVGLAKIIIGRDLPERVRAGAWTLARAFGVPMIQEETMRPVTCTGQAASMGIPGIAPEVGGDQLPTPVARRCMEVNVRGIRRVMGVLGMVSDEPAPEVRCFIFQHVPHIRPRAAGYLVSAYDPVDLFSEDRYGVEVQVGQTLGQVFDAYTLEDLETLTSPVHGILYMARRSGPVEAGAHAFAVAAYDGSRFE